MLPPDVIESVDYNPEQMGAWLLGYDVSAISDTTTVAAIAKLI